MSKKVLFICHEASRSGAPMVLLHLLRWIKLYTNLEFEILIKINGPLFKEFEALGKTHVLFKPFRKEGNLVSKFTSKGISYLRNRLNEKWILRKLHSKNFKLVYSNTITNGKLTKKLKASLKCEIITHVHELKAAIDYFGRDNLLNSLNSTDHFIVVSEAVKDNLLINYKVHPSKISLIYEFISVEQLILDKTTINRKQVLEQLGISSEKCFIICGSGTIEWRKGCDAFFYIAQNVLKRKISENIYFIWIGGNLEDDYFKRIQSDIELIGIQNNIKFIGSKTNVVDYFEKFDLFLLSSREDPYPLVCLENAALGKPIICFEKAGGMPEFVQQDCGETIPFLDIQEAANAIENYYKNPDLIKKKGKNAQNRLNERHDVSIAAPLILNIINNHL